jgi:hypothetical protein
MIMANKGRVPGLVLLASIVTFAFIAWMNRIPPAPARPLLLTDRGEPVRSETKRLHALAFAGISEGLTPAKKLELAGTYGKIPLSFEANQGQTNPRVKFLSRGSGYSLFLTPTEAVLTLRSSGPGSKAKSQETQAEGPDLLSGRAAANEFRKERRAADLQGEPVLRQTVLRMKLVGSNPAPKISGVDRLPGKSNYFIGDDPKKWRTDVSTYAKVNYEQVYPGVDLVYHGTQGKLEYDFVVAPGADPGLIRLSFPGADRLELDPQGDLVLHTAVGAVREHKPVVYQEIHGVRQAIAGSYVLQSKAEVGFAIAQYDASQPLIIDPVLSYSTYLGGSGGDEGRGIAVDSAGNAYVTGETNSADFPTTPGAFQTTSGGGGCDWFSGDEAFVTKLNPAGTALVYSTYLGGSGCDGGVSIAVDSAGNAYVAGWTESTNFPTTPGAFQPTFGVGGFGDAFVTKLDPTGSALDYSTYLGGDNYDQGIGIAVDSAGNAYVAGSTSSANFPTTPGAFQTIYPASTCAYQGVPQGISDLFVTKLNPTASALDYSTYLGGSGCEGGGRGSVIAVDSAGNAYVTGVTRSADFPTTPGAFRTTYGGGACSSGPCGDAFVTKLNPTGSTLVYSTYLGGSDEDNGLGIAVDSAGHAYVTGVTLSTNFPTTPSAFQTAFGGFDDAFVTTLNPTGTARVYSTYLGGSSLDEGLGIAVDSAGNAYVTGRTQSSNFPTTTSAFQPIFGGYYDAFVTKLNPTGTAPLYSTYLGGSGAEGGDLLPGGGIAVDATGNAYVAGITSGNFPTTPGAFQTAFGGGTDFLPFDAFVTKIVEQNVESGLTLTPSSLAFGNQVVNTTSVTTTVTLANTGTTPVSISSIANEGDDAAHFDLLTSPDGGFTCAAGISTLAAGASCTFGVSFAPTTTGAKSASIAVTSDAAGSPHSIPLSGTGTPATPDFTLAVQGPESVTVNAGRPASFMIAVAGQNGFSSAVTFTCSSPAAHTNCTANPASVTPPGNTTVTVTTTARSGMLSAAAWQMRPGPVYAPMALLAALPILLLPMRARRVRLARSLPLATVFLALVFLAAGCGGGGGGRDGATGTPPGTYTITVKGTSGGTTHNATVTVIVN